MMPGCDGCTKGQLDGGRPLEEIDIWRTAKILVDAHGAGAELEAAMRGDKAMEDGHADAVDVWKRVMRAVVELQRTKPASAAFN